MAVDDVTTVGAVVTRVTSLSRGCDSAGRETDSLAIKSIVGGGTLLVELTGAG